MPFISSLSKRSSWLSCDHCAKGGVRFMPSDTAVMISRLCVMQFTGSVKRKANAGWSRVRESWNGYTYGRRYRDGVRLSPAGALRAKTALEEYYDQHETGPGVFKWRHYWPIYDRHFSRFRGSEVHVLEVGVYSGGSLDIWREYFGDGAHVYGIDIDPRCQAYERPGVRVIIGDQADPEFWRRFLMEVPALDIVIDDGGHRVHQQRATLEALLPHIRPGGVYVCEDLHGSFNPFLSYIHNLSRSLHTWKGGTVTAADHEPSGFQESVDSIHLYPFVVVLEKRAEQLDRLVSERRGNEWLWLPS
jgi:SAM-dependent methyltransferase